MLQLDGLMVPFNVYTRWKEADMGKSIKGKELGKGITQRKSDGLYQGRFVLSCDGGYTVYRNDEDGKGCLNSKVCSKCVVRLF